MRTRGVDRREETVQANRAKAEARLARLSHGQIAKSHPEVQRLVHELAVHQVELEMQNEELRQAQASLETARSRYFDLYDQAPVAYATLGPEGGKIVECNRGALALFQSQRAALIGRPLRDFVVHGHAQDLTRRLDELLATGQVQSFEVPLRRPNGTTLWAQVEMNAAGSDNPGSARVALADITARKQLEDETARLASIVNSSDQAIFGQDLTGLVTSWNPAAERLFGYAAPEIVGSRLGLLFPPERLPEEHGDRDLVRQGRQVEHETARVRRDGSQFPAHVSISPVFDPHGRVTGACHILRDITEEHATRERVGRLLRDLRENEDALRLADRRKDEFIAMLAHELRNPLAPIRNAAAALRYGPRLDPKLEWCRDVIDRQVTHMATLLDDLLDVSRITRNAITLHRDQVELSQPIAQALEITRPLLEGRSHMLTVDLPASPVMVIGDATRLAQVFGNLLNNAAKYTQHGGRISLRVAVVDGVVEVRVRDNGIGIPPASLPQVFDMFSQLENSGERQGGLGIGLSLVKALVEMHGGNVAVSSEGPGLGSEFAVRLPIAESQPDEPAVASIMAVPEALPEIRRRVLVVDDNRDSAESLGQILAFHGCDVMTAGTGEEAIEILREFRPDVAILDLGLPHIGGLEVGRQIRKEQWGHSIVLIACTGWGQPEDVQRSREAGFDHHMVKPVNLDVLLRLLSSRFPPPAW